VRQLTFQFIADNRFYKNPKKIVEDWTRELIRNIDYPDISISLPSIRKVIFNDGTISYRQRCYISKNTRSITWQNIYEMVNKINPAYFKLIN